MNQGLFTAAAGMRGQQRNIDVIANNIANIQTAGYKKDRVNFKDALYTAMLNPANVNSTENLLQGTGVLINTISKIYTPSNYKETGNSLDMAILDESGFFTVRTPSGETQYTRDGNFSLSVQEDGTVNLVTSNGDFVLDDNNEPIVIDGDISHLQVDSEGNMSMDGENTFGTIKVVKFTNPQGLEAMGDCNFSETVASGNPQELDKPNLKHKFLEESNVELADEIVNLIKAQRAYQLSSKVLTVNDEMEGVANNMRS